MVPAGVLKSILLCLVIGLAWANAAPSDQTDALEAWEDFLKTYGKTYASDEEYQLRKEQFLKNYASLESKEKQVSSGKTYTVGVTQFSDLSQEEFLRAYTGVVLDESQTNKENVLPPKKRTVGAPTSFDWRAQPFVMPPIRNQGQCGSCWAFTMAGTLETMYNIKHRKLNASFSEQHLVDCNLSNFGCQGGNLERALLYLLNNGTASKTSYPYANLPSTVMRNTCKSNLQTSIFRNFAAYYATGISDAYMQEFISGYSPLAVYIDGAPLQTYTGGILNAACTQINHAVIIVGYGRTSTGALFYIARNSWGTTWGESGYFRISATNPCFIKNYAYFGKY